MATAGIASFGTRALARPIGAWRIVCVLPLLIVWASVTWSMMHWGENRPVFDDVCYLRQAHLFQRFGVKGIDTDIARNDDRYLVNKLKEIGNPIWRDAATAPCHHYVPGNKKVMRYPPGTGFLLAAFPERFQVVPLYVASATAILIAALSSVMVARSAFTLGAATLFGCVALYLMINPGKSSFSLPPTLVICIALAYLTILMFAAQSRTVRLLAAAIAGLLLGLSVNIRLANVLLAAGHLSVLAYAYVRSFGKEQFVQGLVFGSLLAIGLSPTLIANAVNVGHPFRTAYDGVDTAPPDFGWQQISGHLANYFHGTQGVLISGAIAAAVLFCWLLPRLELRRAGAIAAVLVINLVVNLAFFLSHQGFTPYYAVPLAMLTMWTVLFAILDTPIRPGSNHAGWRRHAS